MQVQIRLYAHMSTTTTCKQYLYLLYVVYTRWWHVPSHIDLIQFLDSLDGFDP